MITELIKTSVKPKRFCEKTELFYSAGGIWIEVDSKEEFNDVKADYKVAKKMVKEI